ncbi:MAG: rane dipeptidase [Verrucomicrobiota bacterium]|jgi:membrane dipeptidase
MKDPAISTNTRLARLHAQGVIDLHFDLLMDLYEKRDRPQVLTSDFLADLKTGGIGVVAAAVYIEDRYLPEGALTVALNQIARLYVEIDRSDRFAICKSHSDIERARNEGKIAFLIAFEGVEPLGTDLNLLRVFYELGVRVIGLTHARRNAAGSGGVFAPSGSAPEGLTSFGSDLVRECEALGIIIDLAHINPAGFDDILEIATKPPIISHSNARKYYDIERNISDEQVKMVGARGGVIGVNSVLVSPRKEESTLDRYVDHIEHFISLIGIDGVGIGFDFFEFIYRQWSETERLEFHKKFPSAHFIPDLANHAQAPNLTRKLIERGFDDAQIEKILFRNWMRIFQELL